MIEHSDPLVERYLLGALFRVPGAYFEASDVDPTWFWSESHRTIYRALQSAMSRPDATKIDPLVLVDAELSRSGDLADVGGREYLQEINASIWSESEPWQIWYERARDLRLSRVALAAVTDFRDSLSSGDLPLDAIGDLGARLAVIASSASATDARLVPLLQNALEDLERIHSGENPSDLYETGLEVVDYVLGGGFSLGHYCVLAAKRKMGKSRLAIRIATELALRHDFTIDFWSQEMTQRDVARLFLAAASGRGWNELASSDRWVEHSYRGYDRLAGHSVRVFSGRKHVREIEHQTRGMRTSAPEKPYAVIVDYLQVYKGDGQTEYERVTDVTQRLATLARETNVLIIACAQFNRSAGASEPEAHQLRSTGQIEQDVDELLIWHRPGGDNPESSPEQQQIGNLKLALNRHGETREVRVTCDLARLAFESRQYIPGVE